jgi:hypothetical protein
MAYYYSTYGREYSFTLESDGLIHCKDLGLKADTIEELQAQVTEAVKAEKNAPRIPVIILGDRWGYFQESTLGSASSKADRNGYRWVSYKTQEAHEKQPKTKRQTFSDKYLALDTPTNREIVSEMTHLGRRIAALQQEQKALREKLQMIGDPEPELEALNSL